MTAEGVTAQFLVTSSAKMNPPKRDSSPDADPPNWLFDELQTVAYGDAAILAKQNCGGTGGTSNNCVGPGFICRKDRHAVLKQRGTGSSGDLLYSAG